MYRYGTVGVPFSEDINTPARSCLNISKIAALWDRHLIAGAFIKRVAI